MMLLLSVSILLFLCSLLIAADLRYPLLWKISLGATEYGHWFLLLPLIVLFIGRFRDPLSTVSSVVALVTVTALIFPAFSAAHIARSLPERLSKAFSGGSNHRTTQLPFQWSTLWFGPFPEPADRTSLIYAQNGSEDLHLLLFRPRSSSPAPCIVVIHTGGWDSGSPEEFETMNHHLASQGYAVAAISYRFAPKWIWPAQKEDALSAIAFLKKNAEQFGIDPSRFVLFGRSAGGQIAEAVAYSAHDPAIKGCIAFYAPADMNFAYEHLSPEPDILDSKTLLENYLGGSQSDAKKNYDDASPYGHISSSTVPTLLIHGGKDPLTWYRQSERLSQKLSGASVPNLYMELPWGTHAFDYNFNGPGGQISRFAVERFLASVI